MVPVNFTGDETALCYKRERDNSRVVVIVNTSQTGLNITLNDPSVVGTYQDVLEETATTLTGTDHITLPAGAAKVLELQ